MKKYLTYRTATILGWIGLALMVASIFIPSPWGLLVSIPAYLLILVDFAASHHQRGYSKGHADARTIVTEEVDRLVAEINQMNKPYLLQAGPIDINLSRVPIVQSFGPNPLEAELNRGLAADKAEEPSLWGALKESRDAEDSNGLVWGTDYWGDIETEPSEEHARNVARLSLGTNLYSRQPHCEWVKVDDAHIDWQNFEDEPRLCDSQNAQPTAKEHRCQSCGVLTDTVFCEPACEDSK